MTKFLRTKKEKQNSQEWGLKRLRNGFHETTQNTRERRTHGEVERVDEEHPEAVPRPEEGAGGEAARRALQGAHLLVLIF